VGGAPYSRSEPVPLDKCYGLFRGQYHYTLIFFYCHLDELEKKKGH